MLHILSGYFCEGFQSSRVAFYNIFLVEYLLYIFSNAVTAKYIDMSFTFSF